MLDAGARVVATDLSSAVEANYSNCGTSRGYFVCQADIRSFRSHRDPSTWSCVWASCSTRRNPKRRSPPRRVREPGGLLAIDHYSRDYPATLSRRLVRSLLLRMSPERARMVALGIARALLPMHRALWHRRRGFGRLRRYLGRVSPVVDYYDAYPELNPELLSEWALLDTHDTLTDRYRHLRDPERSARRCSSLVSRTWRCAPAATAWRRAHGPASEAPGSDREVSMHSPTRRSRPDHVAFGLYGPRADDALHAMVRAPHHRGPDDRGVWVSDSASLGMARLAVLDLTAAATNPWRPTMARSTSSTTAKSTTLPPNAGRSRPWGALSLDVRYRSRAPAVRALRRRLRVRLRGMFALDLGPSA
jgi:hypothetical protein